MGLGVSILQSKNRLKRGVTDRFSTKTEKGTRHTILSQNEWVKANF